MDVIMQHFEKLFQFARRTEELLINKMPPEEVLSVLVIKKKNYFHSCTLRCSDIHEILQIPFQVGMSKGELRKVLKSTISGVFTLDFDKNYHNYYIFCSLSVPMHSFLLLVQLDKSQSAMYKKLQKNLTVEELIPSLWEKCKVYYLSSIQLKHHLNCKPDDICRKNVAKRYLIKAKYSFKLQKEFLEKYASFVRMVQKIYPSESIPSEIDMQKILASLEM
jgi:exocyst complex component 1